MASGAVAETYGNLNIGPREIARNENILIAWMILPYVICTPLDHGQVSFKSLHTLKTVTQR